jgi:hypothetical protein
MKRAYEKIAAGLTEAIGRWPFVEQDSDCWKPGSGFVVETCLAAVYDDTLKEEVPEDFKRLLNDLD